MVSTSGDSWTQASHSLGTWNKQGWATAWGPSVWISGIWRETPAAIHSFILGTWTVSVSQCPCILNYSSGERQGRDLESRHSLEENEALYQGVSDCSSHEAGPSGGRHVIARAGAGQLFPQFLWLWEPHGLRCKARFC